jgi:DNA-binding beta-propeller fold protein YncE
MLIGLLSILVDHMKGRATVMKFRTAALGAVFGVGLLAGTPSLASAQSSSPAITPTEQDVALPGSPFAVASTPDGRYVFASLSGDANGIAILAQGPASAKLLSILPTGGSAWGLTVSANGAYLLDTVQPVAGSSTPAGVQIINIRKAIAGDSDAILGTIPTGSGSGPIEVALSNDQRYAFVTNEDNETVGVINFGEALATNASPSSLIGNIPVEIAPVGIAFSPDGQVAYISNEAANPTDPGYSATACNTPTGIGTGTTPGPQGTLTVVNLHKAEIDPADSVVSSVWAGCSPVRVVLSHDGRVAWVTDRASDQVAAYNTNSLVRDPSRALISETPVGTAPVGIQLFDGGRLIAVADSNRFTIGQAGSVSILDESAALRGAGTSATVGTFIAGDFPRQWDLTDNQRELYLTEFSSNTLAILPTFNLVKDVLPNEPHHATHHSGGRR